MFIQKDKFIISKTSYIALVILKENQIPKLYIIPSTVWNNPNKIFVDKNYNGLESKPEYGINISQKNMDIIEGYSFNRIVNNLISNK